MTIMHRLVRIAALTTLSLVVAASPGVAGSLEEDLDLMMTWFAGEFDNHLQVVEQEEAEDPPEQPHEWIHSIFSPVELPEFGEDVFYVEQYIEGDPTNIYRNRIYSFSVNEEEEAIQLTIFSFKDHLAVVGAHDDRSKLEGLTMDDVRTLPGCEVFWKKKDDHFIGYMPDGACRVQSRRSGKTIIIDDDLKLTPDEIWIGDRATDEDGNYVFGNKAGIPHKLKRSHDFACWAVLKTDRESEDWDTVARGLTLHDQGGWAEITTEGDDPQTYKLELERRVYRGEREVAVLKLGVYEGDAEESSAYTWSEPTSTNIGMNLRWFQAGCTKR
jgi:hypothetical protein